MHENGDPGLRPGDKVYAIGPRWSTDGLTSSELPPKRCGPENGFDRWQMCEATVAYASWRIVRMTDYAHGFTNKIYGPGDLGRVFFRTPREALVAFRQGLLADQAELQTRLARLGFEMAWVNDELGKVGAP